MDLSLPGAGATGTRAQPGPHGTAVQLPAPLHPWPPLLLSYLHPQRLFADLHSGFSSGLKSWLMATSCNLVTSETMTVDFRRSSMCTDCHSPVGGKSHLESPHAFPGVLLSATSRDTPQGLTFQYILLNDLYLTPKAWNPHRNHLHLCR